LHFHSNSQQFFFVLKGLATFYIKGEKTTVQAQQGIHILPNMPHCIANETQEAIEFLVVSQPSTNNDRTVID
jgi:mannose-6-phosphate isomerase-like protein (cupin superfamily)